MENASQTWMDYVYTPLKEGEIRLLTLLPCASSTPISLTISHVSLTSEPVYEALSYAWGEAANERSVLLEGKEMRVRGNLHDALYHIRRPENALRRLLNVSGWRTGSGKRTTWIDALCINQVDLQE